MMVSRALLGACFISCVIAQGFIPPFVPVPVDVAARRQLTPAQQSHILSDIQQHQHRFALHQQQKPNFLQPAPAGFHPSVIQPRNQNQFLSQNQFLLNQQQSQNSFRTVLPPNGRPNGNVPPQSLNSVHQHHTQTNFVPNFQQQQQQQQQFVQPLQFQPQQQFGPQPQRSVQNQLQQTQSNNVRFPTKDIEITPSVAVPLPSQGTFPQAAALVGQSSIIQQQQQQQQQPNQQPFLQSSQTQNRFPINSEQQQFINQQQFLQNQQQLNNFAGNQQPQQQFLPQLQQQFPTQQTLQTSQLPATQFPQQQIFFDTKAEEERLRDLKERERLIQKHEQFYQKQIQKQQAKVLQQHNDFLISQQQIRQQQQQRLNNKQQNQHVPRYTKSRGIYPAEVNLFQKAVKQYEEEHPTTTTTTTSTTTEAPPPALSSLGNHNEITISTPEELEQLLQGQRLLSQFRQETKGNSKSKSKGNKSNKGLGRDDLIRQLKLALAEQPVEDLGDKNYSSMDIVLPDGQKVQVIRTTDPNLVKDASPLNPDDPIISQLQTSANNQPPPNVLAQLSQSGFLPEGADIEVVRQSADGKLQEVSQLPAQKKVTFVYLEEQDDGSYKVQGVKGNGDKEAKTSGSEVDSILNRIKNGEIQLPPPSFKTTTKYSNEEEIPSPVYTMPTTTTTTTTTTTPAPTARFRISPRPTIRTSPRPTPSRTSPRPPPSRSSPRPQYTRPSSVIPLSAPENGINIYTSTPRSPSRSTPSRSIFPSSISPNSVSSFPSSASPYSTLATINGDSAVNYQGSSSIFSQSTTSAPNIYQSSYETTATPESSQLFETTLPISSFSISSTPAPVSSISKSDQLELTTILKNSGLHAMSKYLKQSGLDSILNETGPYTIFAPTDKAFKSLLVQLGGPEKAEEKFKTNPRLLSGLLLHHVIPGAFEIATLQDEMTGVSLAGTQLRVNQYKLHDAEWNDVKVTTINGAMVTSDKQDITIPQGVAHGIDRVMFPLPVGDLLQTLQSDRERRFTNFLRALFTSDFSDVLQNKGPKTYTVFAPTDDAFSKLTTDELNQLVTNKESATALVMKHITPGTLFSSGMRFYQIKESMSAGKPITLQKNTGKIKINDGHIVTSNIPATNGVIHAVDILL